MVFHLIDARHSLTATDKLVMDIASRAAAARAKQQNNDSGSSDESSNSNLDSDIESSLNDSTSSSNSGVVGSSPPRLPFLYAVVLTKIDKAGEKQVRQTEMDVRAGLAACGLTAQGPGIDTSESGPDMSAMMQVPVLKTSSVARMGRDDVWKLLQSVIA